MGSGEPLDNYDNVLAAVRMLNAKERSKYRRPQDYHFHQRPDSAAQTACRGGASDRAVRIPACSR